MSHTLHRLLVQSAAEPLDLQDGSIDLVVTSPPYPMIEMWDAVLGDQDPGISAALGGGNGGEAFALMHRLLDRVWEQCGRLVRPGGFLCINIGDAVRTVNGNFRLYANHARVISACEALGFQALPLIHWRKQTNAPNKFMGSGMLPAGAYVTLENEYILVFRQGGKRVFAPDQRMNRNQSAFFWEERNQWFSDVWDFKGIRQELGTTGSSGGERRPGRRSAAFPFELAYRLINMYSVHEDTVLDPFAGTGTSLMAAIASGRNSVSVEIDRDVAAPIAEAAASSLEVLNQRITRRAADHLAFVRQRSETAGAPKYINVPHGFPVMTRQEVWLQLRRVDAIEVSRNGAPGEPGICELRAGYRDIGLSPADPSDRDIRPADPAGPQSKQP